MRKAHLDTVDAILNHLSDTAHGSVHQGRIQRVQSPGNLANIVWGNPRSYGNVSSCAGVPTKAQCLRYELVSHTVTQLQLTLHGDGVWGEGGGVV